MITLLFLGADDLKIYSWQWIPVCCKWLFEIFIIIIVLLWFMCDQKARITFMRWYFESPGKLRNFVSIANIYMYKLDCRKLDHDVKFQDEFERFCICWCIKYEMSMIESVLTETFGAVSRTIGMYLFET